MNQNAAANVKFIKKPAARKHIFICLMLLYPMFNFVVFYLLVNFNTILLAFQKTDANFNTVWVGFDNFVNVYNNLVATGLIWTYTKNSLIFFVIPFIIEFPLILCFAYMFMLKFRGYKILRFCLMLSSMISGLVTAMLFSKFADYVLPDVFEKLFGVETISILRDDRFNLQLLLFFNVITAFGANVILYTNAMNSVDISIYEAARMDGAVNLQILTKITIPMSYPTIMTFVVTSVSMIFTADVSNYLFYDFNAPVNTTTVGYYLFYLSKSEFADYNMASVLSIVFTLITFPIVMLVRWGLEKADPMSDRAEVAKCKAK